MSGLAASQWGRFLFSTDKTQDGATTYGIYSQNSPYILNAHLDFSLLTALLCWHPNSANVG
jgi:hypothetical protein